MIQAVAENKYSFNMQVSAEAMAALDRDHSRRKPPLARQRSTIAFNQLGVVLPARLCGRWLTEVAPLERKTRGLHIPVMRRRSVALLYGANYRPALWQHIQTVFVSGIAFGEL
jgi:hypothetical protein